MAGTTPSVDQDSAVGEQSCRGIHKDSEVDQGVRQYKIYTICAQCKEIKAEWSIAFVYSHDLWIFAGDTKEEKRWVNSFESLFTF